MKNQRKVLFIAGSGRSGTSTMAGLAKGLGLRVPQPEVPADVTNPKGFGEPRWVVRFHRRLLADLEVGVSDSRPAAWQLTSARSADAKTVSEAATWLRRQFTADELVVKDPRLSWFLPLWRSASALSDAAPVFVTMLRPPPEVVGSKQIHYRSTARLDSAHVAACWVNMLLQTEVMTRDTPRAFVRYSDLLTDWRSVMSELGERLSLETIRRAQDSDWARLEGFVDPGLRRADENWNDLALPKRLERITREAWDSLNSLADDDSERTSAELDQIRTEYLALYAESEAISKSSAVAAKWHERRRHTTSRALRAVVPYSIRARGREILRLAH